MKARISPLAVAMPGMGPGFVAQGATTEVSVKVQVGFETAYAAETFQIPSHPNHSEDVSDAGGGAPTTILRNRFLIKPAEFLRWASEPRAKGGDMNMSSRTGGASLAGIDASPFIVLRASIDSIGHAEGLQMRAFKPRTTRIAEQSPTGPAPGFDDRAGLKGRRDEVGTSANALNRARCLVRENIVQRQVYF